eukprot:6179672-Pleurochrysis_carterae.AAC.2
MHARSYAKGGGGALSSRSSVAHETVVGRGIKCNNVLLSAVHQAVARLRNHQTRSSKRDTHHSFPPTAGAGLNVCSRIALF